MWMSKRFLLTALIVGFAAIGASRVQAQEADCGNECEPCGFFGREGTHYQANGLWKMDCENFTSSCFNCSGSVRGDAPAASAILEMVIAARPAQLGVIFELYGDRLLVNRDRNLLVVQGTSCNPQALQTMAYLPVAKVQELAKLGVGSLHTFLERQEALASPVNLVARGSKQS